MGKMTETFDNSCIFLFGLRHGLLQSEEYQEYMAAKAVWEAAQNKYQDSEIYRNFIAAETNVRLTCPNGASFKAVGHGTVSHVKGYTKTTWDSAVLKELELTIPEITAAKKETWVEPTCKIVYADKTEEY